MKTKEDIVIREIAGEKVAIRQGNYGVDMTRIISFNPVAEWLWKQLAGKDFSEEDVVRLLTEGFGLDEATARHDALKWINQCMEANIIDG